jgi:LssY C-terminus
MPHKYSPDPFTLKRLTLVWLPAVFVTAGLVLAQTRVENSPPLWVRSQTELSSRSSLPGSRVEAVVIQDYYSPGGFSIPMGSEIKGSIVATKRKDRSALRLLFESVTIADRDYPLKGHVLEVDNARERVEPDGTILGLEEFGKRPGKLELILMAAAFAHPAILASAEATKYIIREVKHPEVHFLPGTDIAVDIDEFPPEPFPKVAAKQDPVTPEPLATLLQKLPNRTTTKNLKVPSDWVNIAFLSGKEALIDAFEADGWSPAAQASLRSDTKTFLAVAEHHSYKSAPVFTFLLDGREPDLVYQKQTNTFAKRHHIRIWLTDKMWNGQPIWLGAATHDTGIDFSFEAKTFAHRVESDIDRERLKIIDDFRFVRKVAAFSYMKRSSVASESKNATGDVIRTDGRLAVVELHQ